MLPTRSGYSDANPHEAQTWNRGLVDIENLGDEVAANNIAAGVTNAAKRITGTEGDLIQFNSSGVPFASDVIDGGTY